MSLRLTLTIHPSDSNGNASSAGTDTAEQVPLFTPTRILSGREALSSLYAYEILVRTTATPQTVLRQLGKRISLEVQENSTTLHRIHGVVMSIESTLSYTPTTAERTESAQELSWYKWTIRPALAKACYSRNRLVYNAAELAKQEIPGASKTATPAEKLLRLLVSRWDGGDLRLSAQAAAHLPTFIQLIQNDESDYNYLSRLLATWGLAYTWQMPEAAPDATPRETLFIFDAISNDREPFQDKTAGTSQNNRSAGDSTAAVMEPLSSQASLWTAHYGIGRLDRGQIALQNYNGNTPPDKKDSQTDKKDSQPSAVLYSIHDESWDQLTAPLATDRLTAIAIATRNNSSTCRGKYQYRSGGKDPLQSLAPGRKVTWHKSARTQAHSSDSYLIISQTITATDKNWAVALEAQPDRGTSGIGILPRPIQVQDRPGATGDPLTEGDAWPEPRMRCFLAIVEDSTYSADTPARNLCKVREIAAWNDGSVSHGNTLWVEAASPYADANSGLLARPRKGNVLVCLDRGDLSIPLALTALFRDSNTTPLAQLKTMDRQTRQNTSAPTTDTSAVTLRNRTRLPERTYTEPNAPSGQEIDLSVTAEGTNTSTTGAEAATRPMSVNDLAAHPLPFSQIQLIALDNGVKPVEQSEHITNTYLASSIVETVMGFVSEADSSAGYAMANTAQSAQNIYNSPVTRPHFEGVNVYSNSDVLLQSADHQIINAGGEIVVTAAQGITLRVGKSSIRITESGIQIASATGKVLHPGAYPAYNTEADGQAAHLLTNAGLPTSGSILVDSSGVSSRGPYVSATATNQVKQGTVLGSGLTITDFSAKLYAPQTTIIGGATLQDTIMSGIMNSALATMDCITTATGSDTYYNASLQDGWKTKGLNVTDFTGSSIRTVMQAVGWVGAIHFVDKLSSLVSVTGSMLKLDASAMTQASPQLWRYHTHLAELDTPLAGFFAMSERASMSNAVKSIPTNSILLGSVAAAGGSVVGAMLGTIIQEMLKNTSQDDTFTKPDASKRPDTTSFAVTDGLGASIGAGVGLTLGTATAGIAALIASKAGKTTEQLMSQLANRCYLSKRNLMLGMEDVQALKKTQTLLQEENDALDKQELALKNDESSVSSSEKNVVEDSDAVSSSGRAVSENSEIVADTSSTLNQNKKNLSASQQAALDSNSSSLGTNTGTQVNV